MSDYIDVRFSPAGAQVLVNLLGLVGGVAPVRTELDQITRELAELGFVFNTEDFRAQPNVFDNDVPGVWIVNHDDLEYDENTYESLEILARRLNGY